MSNGARHREEARPHPVEPSFYGVDQEPWARYTGTGAELRAFTAWIARRKGGAPRIRLREALMVAGIGAVVFGILGLVIWAVQQQLRP